MADRGIFTLPPGVDFPTELVAGLRRRLADRPPLVLARSLVIVNTAGMRARVQAAFAATGAGFLPRLVTIDDLALDPALPLPPPEPPLRRPLALTRLIAALLDRAPDLAPRAALFDLAESLAALLDEMEDEDVPPDRLAALDMAEHAAHWRRMQAFLAIAAPLAAGGRLGAAVAALADRWAARPPQGPVVLAGSTGSRGSTLRLMGAVLALPQGAVVLPGHDGDTPAEVWDAMDDALTAEDHPQYRTRRLMQAMGLTPADLRPWTVTPPAAPARNRVVSLALRPAPVTDRWLAEGRDLPDLPAAMADVTLIEAPDPRAEAQAIALILRQAAETGTPATLITPDRTLARRVTAALDRWGLRPDDSAGRPLALSAPGRFLRHVAALAGQRLTAEALLILLKHPLTATGADRGDHLRLTRDLELHLRRHGPMFPEAADLTGWARDRGGAGPLAWAQWIGATLAPLADAADLPLADHVARHRAAAEALATGPAGTGPTELWAREAGQAARAAIDDLAAEAHHAASLGPQDYADLFAAVLSRRVVRETVETHPHLRILGPREARETLTGLTVLGGLTDGVWPALPAPDPWLNRQMRQAAGLRLPERQVGLSAHDFQQAVAAPQVVLTRALRDAEAETIPSRWLNRLMNLLTGLPDRAGPQALDRMRDRGRVWLDLAAALDRPAAPVPAAPRPSPRPPLADRPRELAVTGISRLIRDPYAIYARHILRLYPLDPLRHRPDARLRGSVLHQVLERFVRDRPADEEPAAARARLLSTAARVLAEEVPWPATRALWLARLDRAADAFLAGEAAREGTPVMIEDRGRITLDPPGFTLTARPDRIDRLPDGRLHILDYKTGTPPTERQQRLFDKQLLLEAAMAERGAFAALGRADVARITYVGLGAAGKVETTAITPDLTAQVWEDLARLIARYLTAEQGYTARRALFSTREASDYDHLSRFGEWDTTDTPQPQDVP